MNRKRPNTRSGPGLGRRALLRGAAAAGGAVVLGAQRTPAQDADRPPAEPRTERLLRIQVTDDTGNPLPKAALGSLHLVTLDYEPLFDDFAEVSDGLVVARLPKEPVQICLRYRVAGFGEVFCYADNQGKGFTETGEVSLLAELARTRLRRVQESAAALRGAGLTISKALLDRVTVAEDALARGFVGSLHALAKAMDERNHDALRDALWAGELLAVEKARFVIAGKFKNPRSGFLWGCNCFSYLRDGKPYQDLFAALFNYATVPFYWKGFEPEDGKPAWEKMDKMLDWLDSVKIAPKGHPLMWFHEAGIPTWIRDHAADWAYAKVRDRYRRRIVDIVRRYKDRIRIYDSINESHDWANELGYSAEQMLELTRVACEAAREGDPGATRVINNCLPWSEYVATRRTYFRQEERPLRSVMRHLKECLDTKIPFEAIGLQLYYPHFDMFEIDRLLDRFAALGKPIHITELGVSSKPGVDDRSLVKDAGGEWHGPWTETLQADWIEQFYTIAYSKPAVEAVTYWDFSDAGQFWPWSGFLDRELKPKESYRRLKALLAGWGFARG